MSSIDDPPITKVGYGWRPFSFGIGLSSRDFRFETESLLFVWIIATYFSLSSLVMYFTVRHVKRRLTASGRYAIDFIQLRKIAAYRAQFKECNFVEMSIGEFLTSDTQQFLQHKFSILHKRALFTLIYVEPQDATSPRPGAFTTFFLNNYASVIFCPMHPTKMSVYQKFLLFHEISHAVGSQSAYKITQLRIVFDCTFVILLWALCGFSAPWVLWVVCGYFLIQIAEFVCVRDDTMERFTDHMAVELLRIDDKNAKVAEVLELQRHLVLKSVTSGRARRKALEQLENMREISDTIPNLVEIEDRILVRSKKTISGSRGSGAHREIRTWMGRTGDDTVHDIEMRTRLESFGKMRGYVNFIVFVGLATLCMVVAGWYLKPLPLWQATAIAAALIIVIYLGRAVAESVQPSFPDQKSKN
jgi:hypothetical protein